MFGLGLNELLVLLGIAGLLVIFIWLRKSR